MKNKTKEKAMGYSWRGMFRSVIALRLHWFRIALALALNLAVTSLLLKLPVTTSSLLSGDLSGSAITEAITYYVLTGIISATAVAMMAHAQSYSVRRTRESLWKKMLGLPMAWFDQNDPSDLMSAFTGDSSASLDLVNLIVNFVPSVYYVAGAMLKINEYHFMLALSCFVLFPLKYLYALIMGRVVQKSSIKLYNRIGNLTGFLSDRILHLHLIKTYTNETKETEMGERASEEILKANMRIVHQDNISEVCLSVLDILQKFVVVVTAVILLRQKKIDLAAWLAFFLYSQNLFGYVDSIFNYWTKLKSIQGSFFRITEIMQSETEKSLSTEPFPSSGDIAFRNVTFSYPGTEVPALSNVSFTVPKGTSAAIIGVCGSGKTTAVSLLERLYVPDEGCVTLGGTDVKNISLGDYRRHFSYVQQGADTFGGTVRELVTYGIDRDVSDEEIFEAAKKTGFDEYLALFDDPLENELGPGCGAMSGGQSQRLVLTRELLRDGEIILMDEPTSALDADVSMKIQNTIDTVFFGKTRISVTHDLRFAESFDRIFVFSEGTLAGEGTHSELMESCALYRAMNENLKREETAV